MVGRRAGNSTALSNEVRSAPGQACARRSKTPPAMTSGRHGHAKTRTSLQFDQRGSAPNWTSRSRKPAKKAVQAHQAGPGAELDNLIQNQRRAPRHEVARRPGKQDGNRGRYRAQLAAAHHDLPGAELLKKDTKKQVMATVAAPSRGLLVVCMGLAWLDYRQRRIRTAGEVGRGLGIRVVGAVPGVPNLERHVVGADGEPELEGQPVLESIDAIRTLLLRDADAQGDARGPGHQRRGGEGKTTLASHLASSLARAGRKTLLIDADLRHPAVHQLFELPLQPGFSEVLLGEVEVAEAVQETTLDGLAVIAGGPVGPRGDAGAGPRRRRRHLREAARGVRLHRHRFTPRPGGDRFAADRPAGRRGDPVGACAR